MIPKVIHYCWFGKKQKPLLVRKCIRSWRKFCPDYKIIEWNEDNYDINAAPLFVRQAIDQKKYAFATDYIRLKIIYDYGGIYLDTDVQLIKSLDNLLYNKAYFGFEQKTMLLNTGLGFGAEKASFIVRELMKPYETIPFILESGEIDKTPNTLRDITTFQKHGLITDGSEQIIDGYIHIYPDEYFSPNYMYRQVTETKNTISIHWWMLSWNTDHERRLMRKNRFVISFDYYKHLPNRVCKRILGNDRYEIIKKVVKRRNSLNK